MRLSKAFYIVILLQLIAVTGLQAQMQRQRVAVASTVDDAFWTPTLITQPTTEHIPARNLNVTIMHSFGIATTDAISNFFGFDNVQNVRLGLDMGLTNRWSVGIGRSSQLNVVDIRTKYALFQQDSLKKMPVSISLQGDLGIITQENRQPLSDDVSIASSLIFSRKFSKRFSLQILPTYAHFNRYNAIGSQNLFALGMGMAIHLSKRYALTAEYYPVLGEHLPGTKNAFSLGMNIQTGGHVFQLFFTSTEWHLQQFVIADNDQQFWAGDFRFGFNVNRIFGL
ncbi:DUF5777 family beta-barrel protein [Fodinibius sediminis]|uniref:DUF5777 domain-containing protein n=1 Tax=Fodinibius sediminis TaxID=1214077 RepID=A0A521B183_9BACT|nr:DUF5777 family beta-barrel protein [Fodinibius sediminis]SMO40854.1 hypothetical protein SAMN06265218_10282 [Fodinibius sediminis]